MSGMATKRFSKRRLTLLLGLFVTVCFIAYESNFQYANPKRLSHLLEDTAQELVDQQEVKIEVVGTFTKLNVQHFNEQGLVDSNLSTPKLEELSNQTQLIHQPHIIAYDYDGNKISSQWIFSAKQAKYTPKDNISYLEENVLIQNHTNVVAKTQNLSIDHNEQTASASNPVEIISPQGITTANSMSADLNGETITLHKRVHTRYTPEQ